MYKCFYLCIVLALAGCGRQPTERRDAQEQQESAKVRILDEFAAKHNADTTWTAQTKLLEVSGMLTAELQRILQSHDSVAMRCNLIDVREREGGCTVELGFPRFEDSIVFILDGSDQVLEELLAEKRSLFHEIVVVARIRKVDRYRLVVESSEEGGDVSVGAAFRPFIARGELLAWRSLEPHTVPPAHP